MQRKAGQAQRARRGLGSGRKGVNGNHWAWGLRLTRFGAGGASWVALSDSLLSSMPLIIPSAVQVGKVVTCSCGETQMLSQLTQSIRRPAFGPSPCGGDGRGTPYEVFVRGVPWSSHCRHLALQILVLGPAASVSPGSS